MRRLGRIQKVLARNHHRMRAPGHPYRVLGLYKTHAAFVERIGLDAPEINRAALLAIIKVIIGRHREKAARAVKDRRFRQNAIITEVANRASVAPFLDLA